MAPVGEVVHIPRGMELTRTAVRNLGTLEEVLTRPWPGSDLLYSPSDSAISARDIII